APLPRRPAVPPSGSRERLLEVADDVVDVLDADREPDGLRRDARGALFLLRELAVRGGRRVAGQRLGIADVDQPLEQLERVVGPDAGFVAAFQAEREDARRLAAEVLLRQSVVRVLGQPGVADPRDGRVLL